MLIYIRDFPYIPLLSSPPTTNPPPAEYPPVQLVLSARPANCGRIEHQGEIGELEISEFESFAVLYQAFDLTGIRGMVDRLAQFRGAHQTFGVVA